MRFVGVKLADKIAEIVIRLGGAMVILAVAAIFLFVGKETIPLFLPAKSELQATAPDPLPALSAPPLLLGLDEYESYAYGLTASGEIPFWSIDGWHLDGTIPLKKLKGRTISSAYRSPSRDHLYLGTEDGHALLAEIKFRPVYTETNRTVAKQVGGEKLIEVSPDGKGISKIFGRHDNYGTAHFLALTDDNQLVHGLLEEGGDPRIDPLLGLDENVEVTGLALDANSKKAFAATRDGRLFHWYLEDSWEKPFEILKPHEDGSYITAMDLIIGDESIILGFSNGVIEQWFGVRQGEEGLFRPYQRIRSFERMPDAVTHLEVSGRNKGFLASSRDGNLRQIFTTSGRTMLNLTTDASLANVALSPKLTGIIAIDASAKPWHWKVESRHPEISWKTLFGKVWYESYDEPAYVWQSTGGTDDFEPKLSLTPLFVGTLKGAFYGLLFAIPVAVLAAIYTSQFMHQRFRAIVKPGVEIMAALPSVVIGFLAGLWLAPILEHHVVSVASMLILIPLLVLAAVLGWNFIPRPFRSRLPRSVEFSLITLVVGSGFVLAVFLGPLLEGWFFGGDLRQWIFSTTGQQFEQRNSIVIGFAMGFAVIPIIFTISEDALSNVPQHFVSGSLALGASRWQTAVRIILPTASPGIFSAVMVGFGRAVGETMIVLMATGNTPIMNFSPFNGMRTMSANIAVEIPEAPVGGTLYRVLFLTAILLFVMTFAVNTVAEVVRQRLRDKYKAV